MLLWLYSLGEAREREVIINNAHYYIYFTLSCDGSKGKGLSPISSSQLLVRGTLKQNAGMAKLVELN